jgi:hypothetical protein
MRAEYSGPYGCNGRDQWWTVVPEGYGPSAQGVRPEGSDGLKEIPVVLSAFRPLLDSLYPVLPSASLVYLDLQVERRDSNRIPVPTNLFQA